MEHNQVLANQIAQSLADSAFPIHWLAPILTGFVKADSLQELRVTASVVFFFFSGISWICAKFKYLCV